MGPTGTGKSSFIEAIHANSPRGPLGIAKNTLESVTKVAQLYHVANVKKIYVWRDKCVNNVIDSNRTGSTNVRLLYFHPITDVRLAASKRNCMRLMKSFWGAYNAPTITLVTTMWDQLPTEKKAAAEIRFNSLVADHWGDWSKIGSRYMKFENTFESAMSILDRAFPYENFVRFQGASSVNDYGRQVGATGRTVVEEMLRSRIYNLKQQRETIDLDRRDPDIQGEDELMKIWMKDRTSVCRTLRKF
ncbi:hypothetical protein CVT24_004595 [Panaeolus cyanescens]|uniref:G domain-containing protein n=1 Tax=Panaeolus cyanescens TaxID=181874 RepID=A0A409YBB1_9AGAR|nr:hypothetical protein CVT24_004595 [Panaeolus cyanescens]